MEIYASSLGMGIIFDDSNTYLVPPFQRSYSWDNEQVLELWEDMIYIYANGSKEHFIGSMVFTPEDKGNNKIKILDGQQRFATFVLLLAALRDNLKNSSIEGASEWVDDISKIIYKRNLVTRVTRAKLVLNKFDKLFFEKLAVEGIISEKKLNSHKLILKCYNFFKKEINNKLESDGKEFVEGILDIISNKLRIIRIDVGSDLDAHIIFETLNDRGLDLSVADLLKNYVLSISDIHQDDIYNLWREMVNNIGDKDLTQFLRHYFSSKYFLVRKDDLHKALKLKISNASKAKTFMENLADESLAYSNFNKPTSEFWSNRVIIDLFEELANFNVKQLNILLLSLFRKYHKKQEKDFIKLIRILVNFTFRYSIICKRNPNELERKYSELAIKIRNNEIGFEEIYQEIKNLNPDKQEYLRSFGERKFKANKIPKYILIKIINKIDENNGKKEYAINTKNVNLEHIIPVKPNDEWKKFFSEREVEYEELIYNLGNMTILLDEYNKKISNQFFTEKKQMYKKSKLPLTLELVELDEFSKNEVESRQSDLIKLSETIWELENE